MGCIFLWNGKQANRCLVQNLKDISHDKYYDNEVVAICCHQTLRQKMEINNTAELITDGTGSTLFLASKSRDQFLQFREMLLA